MPRGATAGLILLMFQAWFSPAVEPVSFRAQIAPILAEHCLACHGPRKAKGNYRLDTYRQVLRTGDSDRPGVSPSDKPNSELFHRITTRDEDERMPQDASPLAQEQVRLIERWIEEGAQYDAPDPDASLASIMPPPTYPTPPETYPRSIPISALAYSVDGTELFVSGYYEITVWGTADGRLIRRIGQEGQRTYAIAVHPGGEFIAAASGLPGRLGELRLFNAREGTLLNVLVSATDVVLDAAFSADGSRLVAGTAEGKIHVFDTSDWTELHLLPSHSDWVTAVAWNADGTQFASASRDKSAKVFNATTGERVITYTGHDQPLYGVLFDPDGKRVCSGGADGTLHLWNVEDAKKIKELGKFDGEIYKLKAHADRFFAVASNRTATEFSFSDQKKVREFVGHTDWILSSAVQPFGNQLATGGFDGEVRLWNLEDGTSFLAFSAQP